MKSLERRFIIRKVWWFPEEKCIYINIINVINNIYVKNLRLLIIKRSRKIKNAIKVTLQKVNIIYFYGLMLIFQLSIIYMKGTITLYMYVYIYKYYTKIVIKTAIL